MSIYCNVYTTTGSPHDHAAYAQQGPSLVSSAPPTQSGYVYATSSLPALPLYPVPPPTFRMGLQHKNQLATTGWTPTTTETSPTMAIAIPQNDRLAPTATTSATSGRPSRSTRDGYGSDQGGERTPPSGGSHPPKESKKKIHPCWMCHKSFDRPSTLKKHLLVHTGEKAFACESCGRRFGVASNLNRHAKTCRVAHAATTGSGTSAARNPSRDPASGSASPSHSQPVSGTSPAPASSPEATTGSPAPAEAATSSSVAQRRPARKRKGPADETSSPESAAATAAAASATRSRKRARRAPSPALWVPESLRTFDLTPMTKGTPVPLPPVRPFQDSQNVEERDSFDENTALAPYHPHGWKGRLPGPGLLGNNVANTNGGQILIFNH